MLANQQIRKFYSLAETSSYGSYLKPQMLNVIRFSRAKGIIMVAIALTIAIVSRLIYLNTFNNSFLSKELTTRIQRTQKVPAMRGIITDRNGNALAVSTPVSSIWVDPSQLDELTNGDIKQISDILGLTISEVNNKLNQKNKTFVYLKRSVSPEQAMRVEKLQIEGIYSIQEFKRFYPNSEVTAHVVGFNNVDDQGVEGIEYAQNNTLVGHDGEQQVLRDRQGRIVENVGNVVPAVNGKNLKLSIDNRIQYIAYNALKSQVLKYKAKGGSAIVLDAKTGEVLSMVNIPTYNPNNRDDATLDMIRNRAAIDLYEPGSTMKPLVVAKALDLGVVTPNTIFGTIPYSVSGHLIKDVHTSSRLSVSQIIEKSSDVGVSKIAFKIKPQSLWNYDREIGFGQSVGTGFPGEAKGILRPWQRWRPLDIASMSYGYALSVSLMQMARAYTIFTNKGCILPITFYASDGSDYKCEQVINQQAAEEVRQMLSKVTEDGTGKLAQIDNYTTAGKTGTAHKLGSRGGYSANSYIGSFVGFAPATNPKLIIAVMLDDPHGAYFGGVVAAPVFATIASSSLRILGVKPDR